MPEHLTKGLGRAPQGRRQQTVARTKFSFLDLQRFPEMDGKWMGHGWEMEGPTWLFTDRFRIPRVWDAGVDLFAEPKNRTGTLEPWNPVTPEPAVRLQSWVNEWLRNKKPAISGQLSCCHRI